MNIQIGDIVVSTTGRDKGRYLIVINTSADGYIFTVDGLLRKVEKPKKKKIKHIEITNYHSKVIAEKIIGKTKMTNQDVKRALKEAMKVK